MARILSLVGPQGTLWCYEQRKQSVLKVRDGKGESYVSGSTKSLLFLCLRRTLA